MSEPGRPHGDAKIRCAVAHHNDDDGPCIRCLCGAWVRPSDWEEHLRLGRRSAPGDGDGA